MATREEALALLQQREAEGDVERANKIRALLDMPPIDVETGAPGGVRGVVGASRGPGAKLQALQNQDPSWQPFGNDNYISGDTLYNPPGLDFGDVAEHGRIAAEAGGSLIGGALGMGLGGGLTAGTGAIPATVAGAALGGNVAGTAWDSMLNLFGREDMRDDEEVAKDAVSDAFYNSMGGPTAPVRKAPLMLADEVAQMTGTAPATIEEASDAIFARGGSTTPGMRGSGTFKRIEGALESSPFAGPIMEKHRQQTVDLFDDIIEETTPYAASRDVAGEAASEGFQWNKKIAEANIDEAYREFDRMLEAEGGDRLSRISGRALEELSDEYKYLRGRDEELADLVFQDPDLERTLRSIDQFGDNARINAETGSSLPEAPTYDIIKRLRTMIGKKIDFNSPGSEQIGLKTLYKTLTDDLQYGAREIGGEAAEKAGQFADMLHHNLMRDLETIDPVFKYAENPSDVYQALNRSLLNNPTLAARAKIAMGPNAWDKFTDSWIRLNSRATKGGQDVTGGMASPHVTASSLAELKKQSPEGYRLLTEGKEEALGVIDRLSHMLRDSEQFINRSRTANATSGSMFGGDILGAAGMGTAALLTGQGVSTVPMTAAGVGLVARPIISKLMGHALTSRTLNNALVKVGRTYQDQLPVGEDLINALIVAGANEQEVHDIFGQEGQRPPTKEAGDELF